MRITGSDEFQRVPTELSKEVRVMGNEAQVEYRREYVKCGQIGCRKCGGAKGGHGPYWFAYETIDGQVQRTYAGKTKPPEATHARRSKHASA